ncbi:hypothetical protein ABDK00_017080 [Niabella insulamsoli]|uniref:hypothetical protein n=1 Tax=Niabella insulamsoli TaxID=3144874 RepID=UPI0031FCAF3F
MTKTVSNTRKRELGQAFFTREASELAGVSVREARYVLNMDRKNEKVVTAYMALVEGFNRVVDEVRQLMPEITNENGPECTPNGTEMRGI